MGVRRTNDGFLGLALGQWYISSLGGHKPVQLAATYLPRQDREPTLHEKTMDRR